MLSRKAAPKIYDIIMRMKLVAIQASPRDDMRDFMSKLSPPSSPHPIRTSVLSAQNFPSGSQSSGRSSLGASPLPPLPPPQAPLPPIPSQRTHVENTRYRSSMASSAYSDARSPTDMDAVEDATNDLMKMTIQRPSPMDNGQASLGGGEPAPMVEQPPPPPSANPWDMKVCSTPDNNLPDSPIERRAPVGPDESPVLPSPVSPEHERRYSRTVPRPASHTRSENGSQDGDIPRRPLNNGGPVYNLFPGGNRPRVPTMPSSFAPPIPEENPMGVVSTLSPNSNNPYSPMTLESPHSRQSSQPASIISDHRPSYAGSDSTTSTRPQQNGNDFTEPHPGLEVAPRQIGQSFDEGLIAVDQETPSAPVQMPTKDLSIRPDSSFYHHKGFCEGSKEVLRGGIGVRKTKKPVVRISPL